MLDVRSASLGLREQLFAHTSMLSSGQRTRPQQPLLPVASDSPDPVFQVLSSSADSHTSSILAPIPFAHAASSKLQISMQEMISTSIALKSGLDIEVVDVPSEPGWATLIEHQAQSRTRSPSRKSIASTSNRSSSPDPPRGVQTEGSVPSHIALAIAGLQREILMLRSELNFELWMARENVKHIGRLYQDHVASKTAEVEQQNAVSHLAHLINFVSFI